MSACGVKLIEKKGWSPETIAAYGTDDQPGKRGVDCASLSEGIPLYNAAPGEHIIAPPGKEKGNNAWIVIGRDRPGNRTSGYGGQGGTHCGMISLVAGRMGQHASDLNSSGEQLYAEPNHRSDAAFIYISQKTDVDENLKLVDGKIGTCEAKSAIAIKADNLRFVSRQGIKLVTGTDDDLSNSCPSIATYGIDIIAGNNDDDLQPIVKGENLLDYLKDMKAEVSKLNGALTGFIKLQMEFNLYTLSHHHTTIWPGYPNFKVNADPMMSQLGQQGMPILMDMTMRSLRSLANQKYNLRVIEQKYLLPGHAKNGKTKHINSQYNNVN